MDPITGIIDPGEEPAVTLVREAREEANVEIEGPAHFRREPLESSESV